MTPTCQSDKSSALRSTGRGAWVRGLKQGKIGKGHLLKIWATVSTFKHDNLVLKEEDVGRRQLWYGSDPLHQCEVLAETHGPGRGNRAGRGGHPPAGRHRLGGSGLLPARFHIPFRFRLREGGARAEPQTDAACSLEKPDCLSAIKIPKRKWLQCPATLGLYTLPSTPSHGTDRVAMLLTLYSPSNVGHTCCFTLLSALLKLQYCRLRGVGQDGASTGGPWLRQQQPGESYFCVYTSVMGLRVSLSETCFTLI